MLWIVAYTWYVVHFSLFFVIDVVPPQLPLSKISMYIIDIDYNAKLT